ncbi:MAG: sterol-binding protein, partial [Gemmatimonadetes bacterium]|nr:sterol-binding protein [Gemmatimonadota bacterium]
MQELYNTLNELDLDWEDYLAPLLGDIVTNELGLFAEDARQWSRGAGESMRRNVDEFLIEEAKVVPSREQ